MTTPARRAIGPWLARNSWVGPLVALVVLYVAFSMLAPDSFPAAGNLRTMIRQTAVVGIAALGMTMVVILGGIDLSVGSIVAFTTVAVAGIAGLMQFSRLTVGDPTVASGLELDTIAAVVIGGGTLSGGEGSVLGSLVGAMLMTEIKTGGTHLGLANWVQEIITGVIIIVAVALDRLRHRRGLGDGG